MCLKTPDNDKSGDSMTPVINVLVSQLLVRSHLVINCVCIVIHSNSGWFYSYSVLMLFLTLCQDKMKSGFQFDTSPEKFISVSDCGLFIVEVF